MHSAGKKSTLRVDCPKYLLLDRVVFYEIKIKQLGPEPHKESFSFFTRYSKLLEKHKSLLKSLAKKEAKSLLDFPPKNYCKRLDLSLIVRRQTAFKRYFHAVIDLMKIKSIPEFQFTFSVLFNTAFQSEVLSPSSAFVLPYDVLGVYLVSLPAEETYPEISLLEITNPDDIDGIGEENKDIENVKSVLLNLDARNQKILKYSENLTFILFLDERLGKGAYGEVYKGCTNMNEKEVFAIKEITIPSKLNDNYKAILATARNEISILKSLNHENIVRYVESFENANNIYLVMEYCNDGNLEHYIKNHDLAEKDVIALFKQMINGFKYLHKMCLLHRDVKPSNFLLDNMKIKISDFAFARVILSEAWTESHIGTYPYMAPQILQGKPYNNMSDIWSLGITLFFMLFKRIPWSSENPFQLDHEIREKLRNNRLFDCVKGEKRISKHAEDLLVRMIVYDENLRISWEKLFQHPLLKEEAMFGVGSALKANIIGNNRRVEKTKSEFLKKKRVGNGQYGNVGCMRFCVGKKEDSRNNYDNCEKRQPNDEKSRNSSNLSHYSMTGEKPNPFLRPKVESDIISNRQKGKSTNSALIREEFQQFEKSKEQSIEDLKNFQAQISFRKKRSGQSYAENAIKATKLDFTSINRNESESTSKNASISREKSGSEAFFQPFPVVTVPERKNSIDFIEVFPAKPAKFDDQLEQEEEKTPFLPFSNVLEVSVQEVDHSKGIIGNRHSFQPVRLKLVEKSEEEKEVNRLSSPQKERKEVKFNAVEFTEKQRETLAESHQTACFKERTTLQSPFSQMNQIGNFFDFVPETDEISESSSQKNKAMNALEQKSYQETTLKFKRQDHIRKSCSIASKKLHRRMTYERNILLFMCNIAERIQQEQDFFDFEPQNLAFFLFLLSKLSLLHLLCLRDEENLVRTLGVDAKEWNVYRKSKMYKELRSSLDNDHAICSKFFQRNKQEVFEMINEGFKDWKLSGDSNVLADLLSQNQENLSAFRQTFQRTLKKILDEVAVGLLSKGDSNEGEMERLTLAEDLMILFAVKRHFRWEEGKELNLNKFVEDRQYMTVDRLRERVSEGLKNVKLFKTSFLKGNVI